MNLLRTLQLAITPRPHRSLRFRVFVVLGATLAALAQRAALQPLLGEHAPYLPVFLSVIVAAWLIGQRGGILTALLCVPASAWLFADSSPPGGFESRDYLLALFALLQSALLGLLCGLARQAIFARRAAHAEAASEFENMANHAPGFVWSTRGDQHTGFVNQAWRDFTGVGPEQTELDRLALVHPADSPRVRSLVADARAAALPYHVEYRLRRADGAYRWILEHAVPRLLPDGSFDGFTGSGADITASRHERDELRFIGDLQRELAASLDLQKAAETLGHAIVPALAEWCWIHLFENHPDGNPRLQNVHIHHLDPDQVRRARRLDWSSQSPPARLPEIYSQVLRSSEPRLLSTLDPASLPSLSANDQHLAFLRRLGLVSFLAVPLRVAGKTVGVLSLASASSGRVFLADTLDLAGKIGGIAAFALENARLYRSVREALAAEERARRERERSERQFRSAWEADIFAICVVDHDGQVRAGNDSFLRLSGHTREEILSGRAVLRSRLDNHQTDFGTLLRDAIGSGRRCDPFETLCVRADGATVPVFIGGSLNPDGETAIVYLLDLSARKAAENELQRQRGLLKTIIDAVPAMVAYLDPREHFVLHNLQYEKWLGLAPDAISGRSLRQVLGDESYSRVHPFATAALAGRHVTHETVIEGAGRRRDLMVAYRPDLDPDGRVVGLVLHAYDVTESRRMAAELSRSERRHRTLLTASAAMVWTADARGVLQEVEGWEQFTGIAVTPGTCPLWFRVIHPADRDLVKQQWLRTTDDHRSWEASYRMLAADGRYHHVHARAAAITRPDGGVEEWIGTVTDITQRVEAEQSLRRKEAELKLVVDTMPALVSYIDRDMRYGLANNAYQRWFGVPPESIRGRFVWDLVGEDAYRSLAPRFERAMRGEEVVFEEVVHYRAGGSRWVNATYTPHLDENGEVLGCFILALDITSRKAAEHEIADMAERYRFLADAMPQNVWSADADGRQDYVNHRWTEYTGLDADAAGGARWLEFVHPDDLPETRRRWARAVATGERFEAEHRLRDRSGDYHWFLSLALARRDQDGRIAQWVGTATNIDAQRRAYLDLAEARAELRRHADRLEDEVRSRTARLREVNEELEAFTYSASHDLRVPLHHIHGFAQAILEDADTPLSPSGHANLRLIVAAAERMDTLILDLLAYSRLSRAEIIVRPTPLEPIINDVLAQHRSTIQAKHAVVRVQVPLPDVPADRVGLQQILANLIGNALKFVPPGRSPEVLVRVEHREDRLRLWVEDNGLGIDKRHHESVFKLFQRLHGSRDYPGTGIGLSLVKRAASRMGARCGLESQPGSGSRFWVDFQPSADLAPPPAPAALPPPPPRLAEHAA